MFRLCALPLLLVSLLFAGRPAAAVEPGACTPLWTLVDDGPKAPATRACDPTREKLSLLALTGVNVVDAKTVKTNPAVAEYLAGLLWSDDPQLELVARDGTSPATDAAWATHLRAAAKAAQAGKAATPKDPLLARVTVGDLQALHAFALASGESPYLTYKPIIAWTEFLYRVGTGDLAPTTKLSEVPVEAVRKAFPGAAGEATVNALFGVTTPAGSAARRATGALMHLVEDSFLPGHAVRQSIAGLLTGVRGYQTNARAADLLHARDPGWREAATLDGEELLSTVVGAHEARQHTMNALMLMAGKRPWADAKAYFDDQIFSISGARPSP